MSRGNFRHTAVRHRLATSKVGIGQVIELRSAITVLFGGIIEEPGGAVKIFSVIFRTTSVNISA
jgi:hypothetical protein